ncbi:hypothetical protein ACFL9U_14475 [Thermodesulfobacteriota bacterium]
MKDDVPPGKESQERGENRITASRYERVEFKTSKSETLHQFELMDVSAKGLCFVATEDSAVLNDLEVGDMLKMKYYPPVSAGGAEYLITEIRHITKADQEEFKGQYFVGLLTLEKEEGSVFMG